MDWSRIGLAKPIVAEALRKDFSQFCRSAWPQLHKGGKLSWTWSHDLIAEHLMMVRLSHTKRLIINCPPRFAKSSIAGIFFPVWTWLNDPTASFLCASYEIDLATSHNLARRRIIESAWFQGMFRDRFQLNSDRNLAGEFTNEQGGAMLAASVNSRAMGRGGDVVIVDDPLSADVAYSDVQRSEVNDWFVNMLPQRLNSPANSAIVLIMQRLHEDDPSGFLLAQKEGGWTHLKLPLLAEEHERWVFPISGRVVEREPGDCLDPHRFSARAIRERQANRLVWAGQYQQNPSPIEGNLVRADDIQFYGGRDPKSGLKDPELPTRFDRRLISVDCSFKDLRTSDYVAIVTVGVAGGRRFVLSIVNARLNLDKTEDEIRRQHALLGPINAVLVEDKANGSAVIAHLKETLAGVIAVEPQGGKTARMVAASPEFQSHSWFFDRTAAWTNAAVNQLTMFPNSKFDDISDAISQCAIWLQANSFEFGFVELLKREAQRVAAGLVSLFPTRQGGKETSAVATGSPAPVQARSDGFQQWLKSGRAPACAACGSTATIYIDGPRVRCNQCGAVDGTITTVNIGCDPGCPAFLKQWVSGRIRCGNCGRYHDEAPAVAGVTFAQLSSRRNRFR